MSLKNKIDFALVLSVKNANPNGDPLDGNRPRINYEDVGEISDVCLKRKIRNRMMQEGHAVFVQANDLKVDDYKSLNDRLNGEIGKINPETIARDVCAKWMDVRAFGQVFAYKGKEKKDGTGVSIGIRGPVSIQPAFSVDPVIVTSTQITKSVNNETNEKKDKKGSDTIRMKHRVEYGVYVTFGSVNPEISSRTGFDEADAEVLKNALATLFRNDASSARPEGSIAVEKLVWFSHNCPAGQYSSAKVHRTVKVAKKQGVDAAKCFEDYDFTVDTEKTPGLTTEIIDGE